MRTKLTQLIMGIDGFMRLRSIKLVIVFCGFIVLFCTLPIVNGLFQTSPSTIFSLTWSPDSTKFAVTRNSYIDIFNASNGTLLRTLSGPNSLTNYVDWSPDGSKLAAATAEYGNGLYVWNVTTNQIIATQSIAGESLKWNPDNTRIAVTSINNVTKIWNTSNGQVTDPIAFGGAIDWSPDGTRIVNGIYDQNPITVTNVSTGQQVLVLSGHSNGVDGVDWSPDGTRIASGGNDNSVRVWNASTGTSLLALTGHTDVVTSVSWNTNNTTLASGSGDGTVRLWNTQTGQSMGMIQAGGVIRAVSWSPDGKKLAYGGDTGVVQMVELNNRPNSGTGLRVQYFDNLNFVTPKYYVLTPTVNFNWAASAPTGIGVDTFSARWVGKIEPLFSEAYTFYVTHDDGARLWVNGQQVANNWTNVASAVVDSGTITLAAGVKYDITLEYYENTANASVKLEWQSTSQARQVVPKTQLYAPEGQLTFTGQIGTNNDVYVINPDGTGTTTIANSTASDSGGIWSPDGTKVAFVSLRDGNQEIYMTNADGTGLRRLTNNVAVDKEPCWSPDGTKIIFSSARTGGGDIYSMDITGTGVPTAVRLTTNALNEYRPMYSPVGTKITYVMDTVATGPDIFMMNPDGTSVVQLTTRGGNDVAPFWSPDGTKIALRADISGRGQIFIVTVSPLSVVQATNTATGANYFQSWAPDSSKILFMSTRTGNAEVFTMDSTGNYTNNNQTNLTNTTASSESYAVWAPDGRSIAYSRDSRIWVMNADGSNQRQLTTVTNRYDYEIAWWQPLQIA